MDFNAFPTEIQFEIFSYLTPFEMQQFVSPTCKRWHEIAALPFFWKRLLFSGPTHTSQQINQIFKRSPYAFCVIFYQISEFDWTKDLTEFSAVKHLTLKSCVLTNTIMTELVRIFPNVRKLLIYFRENSDLDRGIINQIPQLKSIEILNLHNMQLRIDGNQFLNLFSRKCHYLKSFSMCGSSNISDKFFKKFVDARRENLYSFRLTKLENLTNVSYEAISACHSLRLLYLENIVAMNDHQFASLQNLKVLKLLSLSNGDRLFSNQFSTIFKNVLFSKIVELVINDCNMLTNTTLRIFLERCPVLKSLHLFRLKNLSPENFSEVIASCKCTRDIELRHVDNLTENCLISLIEYLPRVQSIRALHCNSIRDGKMLLLKIKQGEIKVEV